MSLLIATECGDGIGYGHLTRCEAIADAFRLLGGECSMVVYDATTGLDDWHKNREPVFGSGFDVLLVDSYLADESFYKEAKKAFRKVVVIDDFNRLSYSADTLINPSLYGCELEYKNQSAKILCGREFVILRDEVLQKKRKNELSQTVKKITVTVGGSDKLGLLPRIIKMFDKSGYELCVVAGSDEYARELSCGRGDVATDFLHSSNGGLLRLVPRNDAHCKPLGVKQSDLVGALLFGRLSASEMCDLFLESDIVISGCGQTLHELAFLGVPTIGIAIANDQFLQSRSYREIGFLKQEIFVDESLESNLLLALERLKPLNVRSEIKAIQAVDGNGAKNIAKELL